MMHTRYMRSKKLVLPMAILPALAFADSPKPKATPDAPRSKSPTMEEFQRTLEAQSLEISKLKQAALTIVPAGTVIAFAGPVDNNTNKPPPGWLLCNGEQVSATQYANLCHALGDVYGPASPGNCRLPDYKGRFLRGLDETSSSDRDPEAEKRDPMFAGGRRGAVVGTIQDFATSLRGVSITSEDALHGSSGAALYTGTDTIKHETDNSPNEPNLHARGDSGRHSHALSGGGLETRPRNAAVNFLIRAY